MKYVNAWNTVASGCKSFSFLLFVIFVPWALIASAVLILSFLIGFESNLLQLLTGVLCFLFGGVAIGVLLLVVGSLQIKTPRIHERANQRKLPDIASREKSIEV